MIGSETDEIIEDIFESFFQKYEEGLEKSMRWITYRFSQMAKKKSTINPKNNDGKCFQYALTIALNYENIKKDPPRISKIKPFIDQCNWKEIDFPSSHSKDRKKFESNNKSIVLNILYMPHNTEKIGHAYKSKYSLTCENQVILLMITVGEKWRDLAVKSFSALFRGITGNNNGNV